MSCLTYDIAHRKHLSPVAVSNLFCMGVTGRTDIRQHIPSTPMIPDLGIRKLRAALILEEALETIKALGLVAVVDGPNVYMEDIAFVESPSDAPNLIDIIDGCADSIFVNTGTMLACGVPDALHLDLVCSANNAKFPKGVAKTREDGKFLKPDDWQEPNHHLFLGMFAESSLSLQETQQQIIYEQLKK